MQYDFDVAARESFVRVDYTYTGDIAVKPTDFTDQPLVYPPGAFHTFNLRAGSQITEQVRLELFANNLFNEFGVQRANDLDGAAAPIYNVIQPRTLGATLRFGF